VLSTPRELQVGDILRDSSGQEGEITNVGWTAYELCVIQHNERKRGSTWIVYAHEFDDEEWTWRSDKNKEGFIEWEEDE
jgi:hypothetical protein